MMLSIFLCACYLSVCLLWKNVYLGLLPFFLIKFFLYFNKAVTPYYSFSRPWHLLINLISVSMNLLIMNILYKRDHATCGLCIWLLSLSICSRFLHVLVCVSTLFIFNVWIYHIFCLFVCLSIHQLINIWIVSTFWLLWIVVLWIFLEKSLLEHYFSVLLGINLGVELLHLMMIVCLTYWGTAKLVHGIAKSWTRLSD